MSGKSAKQIRQLEDKIAELEQAVLRNAELELTVFKQAQIIAEQAKIIEEQGKKIAELEELVKELNEKLHKNSNNSSKPPSTDGLEKPKPKSLREPSGKKPGGQAGHKGSGLSLPVAPTQTVIHKPVPCKNCPMRGECTRCALSPARNVLDITLDVQVTAHYTESYECPKMGNQVINGEFPEGVGSSVQYGAGIRALCVALNTVGMMSVNRVHEFLEGFVGLPLSTGTITGMVNQCAQKLENTLEEIRQALLQRPVVHFDETGSRVDGRTEWIHSACDGLYTYLSVQEKRGAEGMTAANVLPEYSGIAIHDCWSSYWFYEVQHGLCCAHLLRELNGVSDNDPPEQAEWAKEMRALLLEMNRYKDEVLNQEKPALSPEKAAEYEAQYDKIIGRAYKTNPVPEQPSGKKGRPKRGKRLALIDRLAQHKEEVCLFLHNLLVPFTNNLAEQSVRMVKVKTKVSGCFRTQEGASSFVKIMSYVQTAAKHGVPAFFAISQAILGNSHQVIFALN